MDWFQGYTYCMPELRDVKYFIHPKYVYISIVYETIYFFTRGPSYIIYRLVIAHFNAFGY